MNDYLVHLLRLRERVEREYDKQLSPHLREVISAYADGLNFYAYWHSTKIIATDLFPISPQGIHPFASLSP
jgi:acyl-homoserine lactone acylase PvdQ